MKKLKDIVRQYGGSFIYASNFSIGVNIFFEINKRLAELMDSHPDYEVNFDGDPSYAKKRCSQRNRHHTCRTNYWQIESRKKIWVNHISDNEENLKSSVNGSILHREPIRSNTVRLSTTLKSFMMPITEKDLPPGQCWQLNLSMIRKESSQ